MTPYSISFHKHRLQIGKQIHHQLNNQRLIKEIHALDSRLKFVLNMKNFMHFLDKTNSNKKFNKSLDTDNQLREEYLVKDETKRELTDLNQPYLQLKEDYKV
ncbi:unnamed protein product [Rotaria sp. Silwood2]|nr:unnamed protein product [Rotaria sp. Silwood2]